MTDELSDEERRLVAEIAAALGYDRQHHGPGGHIHTALAKAITRYTRAQNLRTRQAHINIENRRTKETANVVHDLTGDLDPGIVRRLLGEGARLFGKGWDPGEFNITNIRIQPREVTIQEHNEAHFASLENGST